LKKKKNPTRKPKKQKKKGGKKNKNEPLVNWVVLVFVYGWKVTHYDGRGGNKIGGGGGGEKKTGKKRVCFWGLRRDPHYYVMARQPFKKNKTAHWEKKTTKPVTGGGVGGCWDVGGVGGLGQKG